MSDPEENLDTNAAPPDAEEALPLEVDAGAANAELDKVVAERDKYLDLLQRTQAEFENFKRRTRKEKAEWQDETTAQVLAAALPILDNFERALAVTNATDKHNELRAGLRMVYQQFMDLLKQFNVAALPAAPGMPLDANLHAVVMNEASTQYPCGQITRVIMSGYKINNRILRHSQVAVAAQPETSMDTATQDTPPPDAPTAP